MDKKSQTATSTSNTIRNDSDRIEHKKQNRNCWMNERKMVSQLQFRCHYVLKWDWLLQSLHFCMEFFFLLVCILFIGFCSSTVPSCIFIMEMRRTDNSLHCGGFIGFRQKKLYFLIFSFHFQNFFEFLLLFCCICDVIQ